MWGAGTVSQEDRVCIDENPSQPFDASFPLPKVQRLSPLVQLALRSLSARMASFLALRVALLLVSGVLAPAVLTGKGCRPLAQLPSASRGQEPPWGQILQRSLGLRAFG